MPTDAAEAKRLEVANSDQDSTSTAAHHHQDPAAQNQTNGHKKSPSSPTSPHRSSSSSVYSVSAERQKLLKQIGILEKKVSVALGGGSTSDDNDHQRQEQLDATVLPSLLSVLSSLHTRVAALDQLKASQNNYAAASAGISHSHHHHRSHTHSSSPTGHHAHEGGSGQHHKFATHATHINRHHVDDVVKQHNTHDYVMTSIAHHPHHGSGSGHHHHTRHTSHSPPPPAKNGHTTTNGDTHTHDHSPENHHHDDEGHDHTPLLSRNNSFTGSMTGSVESLPAMCPCGWTKNVKQVFKCACGKHHLKVCDQCMKLILENSDRQNIANKDSHYERLGYYIGKKFPASMPNCKYCKENAVKLQKEMKLKEKRFSSGGW